MRWIMMGFLVFVLLLSGCSSATGTQDTNSDNNDKTEEQDNQEKEKNEKDNKTDEDNNDSDQTTDGKQEGEENKSEEDQEEDTQAFSLKEPKYEMTDNYYIKPIGDADPKVVLLTIDDAPDGHAVEMAETLKKLDAPAIFFINKIFVDKGDGKEQLQKINDMGFAIGNHTVSHPNLSNLSESEQRKEIVPVYEQIKKVTGEQAKFFRAPHGVNTDLSHKLANERDVLVMNWSYGYDFKADYQDAEKLKKIMLEPDPPGLLRDGAILLMHDRDWTNKALEDIVKGLRDKGYKILDPALLKTPQSPQ